jgi:putative oxidoreductase
MLALGLAILRLTLSVVFVIHGANKLFGFWGGPGVGPGGLARTASHFASIGLEPGVFMAVLAGLIQFGGGLLLGIGFLTRWAAAAILGYLIIVVWKEHAQWGFFLNWQNDPTRGQGLEYSLVLIAGVLLFVLAGGGDFSIDGWRAQGRASRAAGRARLRGNR